MTSAEQHCDALTLRGIEKRFGELVAVKRLTLSFKRGEVHALLGENGAGKSTLMNVAAGFLTPDEGEIEVAGQSINFGSPRASLAAGVGMVHQHFRLVEKFTVAENLAIGADDVSGILSSHQLVERARALAEKFDIDVDPTSPIWALSEGEKQRVEILRTLSRGARVLILDEPTAVLTPNEAERLCRNLRKIAAEGTTVIFISHKLNEVLNVADRISIMRHGALLQTKDRRDCTIETLSKMMFEEHAASEDHLRHQQRASGDEILKVSHLSARNDRGVSALVDVSFVVRQREIVGVVGVAGNGQKELEQLVTGDRRPDEGSVAIDGVEIHGIRSALRAGLSYIPEDRKGTGLVPSQSIWRNAILRNYLVRPINRRGLIRGRHARSFASELVARVELSTTDTATLVHQLSGGNAQKLLAGRELEQRRRIVIAVNPMQGLDIKAADAVRKALSEACDNGLAILLISADLDEAIGIADRILVIYEGQITGEFNAEHADRDNIGMLMGGAKQ
jgi:simple sugar transport system ATP-binding protein